MKNILRRLRGVLGTGVTWAVGWGVAFAGLRIGLGFPYGNLLEAAVNGMILGFIGGSSFAVILSIAEHRRTLDQLSLRRVALWGGVGGMALLLCFSPMVFGAGPLLGKMLPSYLVQLALHGLLGAGFASGSVALARRPDPKLIDGEHDPQPRLGGV